ncbi:restriction endonuclease subunit S [Enterobacter hormaechei]|uniref:restriction endonuclease subunit S n=1 Tax=Enterobacter hormaechei TaxID=158836 RepID=UPI0025509DCC|nr:restriction endonuclease subunit S [Enterobacter hormaechei]MDL0039213.1 restriction endonuclease subunit S [Enterobacter hormaechei]
MIEIQSKLQSNKAIPAGYKLTEVGVVPEDWEVATLQDISSKITDGTHDTPKPVRDGIPFLTAIHVKDGRIDFDSCYFLPEKIHNEIYRRCNPEFGDILMVNIGSGTATTAIVNVSYEFSLKNVALIKPRKMCNGFYINYALGFSKLKIIETISTGGAQPFLSLSQISQLQIAKPSFKEQTVIANALSDSDALITAIVKLIAKKQAIKTATMQQLLTGRTRLPQFSKYPNGTVKGYKTIEQGQIPEDWDYVTIGEFTDCTAGGTPLTSKQSYWGGTNPWMSSGELHLRQVYDVAERITDEGLANSSTKYIPKNSVLIGLAGQGKTRGTVAIARISLCTNQSIAAIFPSDSHSAEYLYYNLDSRYEELRSLSTGDGGRGGLNLKIIRSLLIPFPNLHEQIAIATVLSDMDAELTTLEQKLAKVRDIKQGMMQQLLTGRIRLPLEQQP